MGREMSDKTEKNMELWGKVSITNPAFTKQVKIGRVFTAIDPTYQLQEATKLWGPYGIDWGMNRLQYTFIAGELPSMLLVANFWFPGGSFEIAADCPYKPRDDFAKKLLTSARSKALSCLGFSADVFMGKYDDSAYVDEVKGRYEKGGEAVLRAEKSIAKLDTFDKLQKAMDRAKSMIDSNQINQDAYESLVELINERREELLAIEEAD
jgi:hypothetical protein